MPELPDITVYREALERRITDRALRGVRLRGPAFLKTARPALAEATGKRVLAVERMGKRIVLRLETELFLVVHLMVSGRLHWRVAGASIAGRTVLAAFDFESGSLVVTEASSRRRASLHVVRGRDDLGALDPGGLDVFESSVETFCERLRSERHTLKRSLTDPSCFDGIGGAYADEILHEARLSPLAMSDSLDEDAVARLRDSCCRILELWIERLRADCGDGFPDKVTAFRSGMSVHGRFGQPCPRCQAPVQRIVHAASETNYCAPCQTGGTLLADRSLSRLLRKDWPRSIEELELRRRART